MPSHYGNGRMNGNNGRMNGNNRTTTRRATGGAVSNPVTRLFQAPSSPRYYRPDGTLIPVGAPLHQHRDGTIMTEHSMGTNDNSVVVTTRRTVNNNQRSRVNRQNRRNTMSNRSGYVMAGTGERYTGLVVMRGGIPYSTKSGAFEGSSMELTQTAPTTTVQSTSVRRRGGTMANRSGRRNNVGVRNRNLGRNMSNTRGRRTSTPMNRANNRVSRNRVMNGSRQMRTRMAGSRTMSTRRSGGY